jgi:hypothetical protein
MSTITETQLTRYRSPRPATLPQPLQPTPVAHLHPLSTEGNGTCRSWMCGSSHESQGRAMWSKLNQGQSLAWPVSREGHPGIGAHGWNASQSRSTSLGPQMWLGPTCQNSQIVAASPAPNNTINVMACLPTHAQYKCWNRPRPKWESGE